MDPFNDTQVLESVGVPDVDGRVLAVLSTGDEGEIRCHCERDDLAVVLQVVLLLVELGVVDDDDAGSEVDQLLVGCLVLTLLVLDVGKWSPHVLPSEPVHPVHLHVDVPLVVRVEGTRLTEHLLCQRTDPLDLRVV